MITQIKSKLWIESWNIENNFTNTQRRELEDILNKIAENIPPNPLKAKKMIDQAEKLTNQWEEKYLSYGGSPKRLKIIKDEILNESIPMLKKSKDLIKKIKDVRVW